MLRATFLLLATTAATPQAESFLNTSTTSNCDWVSDHVTYVDVDKITADGPLFIGKDPLPENAQGLFWLVDDGGDALVALGTSPSGGDGECSTGKLIEKKSGSHCTTVSTVRPGGWSFQAEGTPWPFGGKFPTVADELYRKCGMKWEYCFNDNTNPTHMDLNPHHTRGFGEAGCIDPFPLTSTTAEYKDKKLGGHYWRVTTKAFGKIPVPGPGNFDMIQVMDGHGNRIQPAWDAFAKANKQIVYYDASTSLMV